MAFFDKFKKRPTGGGEDAPPKGKFSETLAHFFRADTQTERVLRHEDFDAAGDVYYAKVSARYKVAQRILCLLLVLFMLLVTITNFRQITYGNLFYFFRDFGNAVDLASSGYETLSYDVYSNQSFSLYRGGIAAVSPTNVLVFTASGRRTLKSAVTFSSPQTVCSEKYVLVYDHKGDTFSIYNSFAKVYTESFKQSGEELLDAALSPSGGFAVMTRATDYKSVIYVYDENFKRIGKFSKDLYAFDFSLNGEGDRMATLYYDLGDGRGRTVFRVLDVTAENDETSDRVLIEESISAAFPIACTFLTGGRVAVLTDTAIRIFDEDGSLYDSTEFTGTISAAVATENGVAVALTQGSLHDRNRVIAYDADGNGLFDDTVTGAVNEIAVMDRFVFLRTVRGVKRVDTRSGDEQELECQGGNLLVYDGSTAIVCGESKAVYLKFGN